MNEHSTPFLQLLSSLKITVDIICRKSSDISATKDSTSCLYVLSPVKIALQPFHTKHFSVASFKRPLHLLQSHTEKIINTFVFTI